MPAGVTWSRYLTAIAASMLSMAAGAQVVHQYYRPLEDLDLLVQTEIKRLNEIKKQEENLSE